MDTLFYLGLIFVLGALSEWISPKVHLPKVVGYLLLGLVIGPEVLAWVPQSFVTDSHIIIDVALSLIAVMVGASLKLSALKEIRQQVLTITLFESIFSFIIVTAGFLLVAAFFIKPFTLAVMLALFFGAIAAATAPAAIIAIVHELKAKGRFTTILLAIVALDDGVSIILFAIALAIGNAINGSGIIAFSLILDTLILIGLSVGIGAAGALITTTLERLLSHHKGMETISTIGMIFIVYSLNLYWDLEPLLSALVMGAVLTNISEDFDLIEEEIDAHLEEIIFILFFVLSAMHLNLETLSSLPAIILLYILLRLIGKVSGAYLGSKFTQSSAFVQKHLGFALIPQAGVAIGLALSIQDEASLAGIAPLILNIVIATTIVHEFIGPIMTSIVLKKSGETHI